MDPKTLVRLCGGAVFVAALFMAPAGSGRAEAGEQTSGSCAPDSGFLCLTANGGEYSHKSCYQGDCVTCGMWYEGTCRGVGYSTEWVEEG